MSWMDIFFIFLTLILQKLQGTSVGSKTLKMWMIIIII